MTWSGVLSWALFGLVAGALAKLVMPGKDPGGCIVTILIGIVGALIGGFIGQHLWQEGITGFNLPSLGLAVLGSLVLLALYRLVIGGRRS